MELSGKVIQDESSLKRLIESFPRRALLNAIHRNASDAIKFNYHTNKDKISHASGQRSFEEFCLRTVGGQGGNSRIPKSEIHDTVDVVLQQVQLLMEVSLKINQYYGRQILFALTSAFICITVQLYYLIIHMRSGFVGIEQVLAFCSCILIMIHFVEFAVILMAGDKVKKEVC